jgi:hypothetical protein
VRSDIDLLPVKVAIVCQTGIATENAEMVERISTMAITPNAL